MGCIRQQLFTMSLVNNDLPPNWIRKESKSRSNQFYFFNVKTGETQWRKPENNTNNDKKTKETDEKSRFKIGSKSKKGRPFVIFILF